MTRLLPSIDPRARLPLILLLLLGLAGLAACSNTSGHSGTDQQQQAPRVLVFTKTAGYYHTSIPAGLAAIQKLGEEAGFAVDTSSTADPFTHEGLSPYQAIIFLNTTEEVLNSEQEQAFERYIKAGGGFVGIHAAADTEYDWPWFGKLLGARFANHPEIQDATILVTDKNHPASSPLPERWQRRDEWYNFKEIAPTIQVLAWLDESTYSGGTHGKEHPFAWYQPVDGGRVFYTAGGHTEESYQEPLFLQHLLGGIRYAMGLEEAN